DVEDVVPAAGREAPDVAGEAADHLVTDRDPRRVRLAVPLPRRQPPAPEAPPPRVARDRVVTRLHDEGDDRLLGPAADAEVARRLHRVAGHGPQPRGDAGATTAIGQRRAEEAHHVAAVA